MKTNLRKIIRPLLMFVAIGVFAVPAVQAGPMIQARDLAQQAHDALKNDATADKGGHRVKALRTLKQAINEINAGIEFDKTHTGPNENKKRKH